MDCKKEYEFTRARTLHRHGFTLLEFMLSIALIGFIMGISVPIYQAFQTRNDIDIAQVTWVNILRRAQIQSQGMVGDQSWGANISTGSITLFKGANFASRDSAFDEVFEIPVSITISGVQEIVFSKLTGYPATTGTTIITSVIDESKNITINEKGMISY